MFQVLSDLTDTHERVKMVVELMALEVEPDKSKRLSGNCSVAERIELLKAALNPVPEVALEIKPEPERIPEPSVETVLPPPSSFGRRIKEIALALLLD
jgi:hypothetical protein